MLLRCFEIRSVKLTKLLGLVRGPPEDSEAAIVRGQAGASKIGYVGELHSVLEKSQTLKCSLQNFDTIRLHSMPSYPGADVERL
jgi:hypothetical protein